MTMQMVKDSPYVFVSDPLRTLLWFMFLLAFGGKSKLPGDPH
ncbi:MAG: hypothetical protein WCE52_21905 [Candidatus Acidiferrum sp.]